jgi:hypothetical protein
MPSLDDLRNFARYHLVRRVHDYPAPETQLGVELLAYDEADYAALLRRPRAIACKVEQVAEVGYRGRRHAIHEITAGTGTKRLLVLAGVHGNEHAGVLAVPRLLDALEPAELRDVSLVILTPVNPVGAAHGSRYNAHGFDINRDFTRFETPEAQLVRDTFAASPPYLILSLHEGPQDATFLFANRLVPQAMAMRLLAAIEAGGTLLATRDYFGRTLEPAGYAPMSRSMYLLSVLWARTLGMMATSMWADGHGLPEITLESSWRHPDAETRMAPHVSLVRAALAELQRGRAAG